MRYPSYGLGTGFKRGSNKEKPLKTPTGSATKTFQNNNDGLAGKVKEIKISNSNPTDFKPVK